MEAPADQTDLLDVESFIDEIIGAIPDNDPNRGQRLRDLSDTLLIRFTETHHIDDLDRAIAIKMMTVDSTPDGPNRQGLEHELQMILSLKASVSSYHSELEQASMRQVTEEDKLERVIQSMSMEIDH